MLSMAPPVLSEETVLLSPQTFKSRLIGPVLTIMTPFTEENEVDHVALREMIVRAFEHGCHVVSLTSGNSQYEHLSEEEIRALTRTVVEAARPEGISIASTGPWELPQVLDYIAFAEDVGASAVQVNAPKDASLEDTVAFYRQVSEATPLAIVLHGGDLSEELLDELVRFENVVAMKEDAGLEFLFARQLKYGDRLNIFPGGFDSRFLVSYPYGARSYYTAFYQFVPELGEQFWKLIQEDKILEAGDWVKRYDYPFQQKWTLPFYMATLEYFGAAKRYVRPKADSFTDAQMEEVKAFWESVSYTAEGKGKE